MTETIIGERTLLRKINRIYKRQGNVRLEDDLHIPEDDYYLGLLSMKRLIAFKQTDDWGAHPKAVVPTDDGLHFFETKREAIVHFAIRSVLVPVIVSAVTTLITIWIHELFG